MDSAVEAEAAEAAGEAAAAAAAAAAKAAAKAAASTPVVFKHKSKFSLSGHT